MAWKFLNVTKANAELYRLHKQLAAVGNPQPNAPKGNGPGPFLFLNIGKANAEIMRLTDLLESRTPPIIGQSISGQPAISSLPLAPPPVAPRAAGLPGTLSRFQLLSALELFPTADLHGMESDEDLAALLKNASAEAGIRLPGEPAEPTPHELRTAKLNQILSAPAQAVTAGAWGFESLAALVDSVFGVGTARTETGKASLYDCSAQSKAAQLNKHLPGSYQWNRIKGEMEHEARHLLSAQSAPEEQQRQLDALRSFLSTTGLKIPGMCFIGLAVSDGSELEPAQRAVAQKLTDEFCAVLNGDEEAGRVSSPIAAKARQFIAATNRTPFQIGMVPGQRAPEVCHLPGRPSGWAPKSGI
jgi:hypothetical protein